MSDNKVYGIVIDDYSAPGGCSGTDMLFGTESDIDDAMAAYREHRIRRLERERDEAQESLLRNYVLHQMTWDAEFKKKGRPFRVGVTCDDDREVPNWMNVSDREIPLDDDGDPNTSEMERRLARSGENLAQKIIALDNDIHTYDGAWRRFKAGQEDAQVGAAYTLQRFAYEATVKESLSFELPATDGAEVVNVWGWPYKLKWASAKVDMLWLEYPNRYAGRNGQPDACFGRVCKLEFEHFAIEDDFTHEYNAPWSHWGMPGLLEQVGDPSVIRRVMRHGKEEEREIVPSCWLRARLYLEDKQFSSEGEMYSDWELAKMSGKTDVNLVPLCLAIVGNG